MRVTATEAKNRFGRLCALGERPTQYGIFTNSGPRAADNVAAQASALVSAMDAMLSGIQRSAPAWAE